MLTASLSAVTSIETSSKFVYLSALESIRRHKRVCVFVYALTSIGTLATGVYAGEVQSQGRGKRRALSDALLSTRPASSWKSAVCRQVPTMMPHRL